MDKHDGGIITLSSAFLCLQRSSLVQKLRYFWMSQLLQDEDAFFSRTHQQATGSNTSGV